MGDSHVGLQARLMSQALRKLAGTLNRTDTICLFTNQLREKIGVMFGIAGDDAGRPRAQVLRLGATRHPPDRDAQGRRRGDRQPRAREGRQEQGRAAVQAGRVRHHLRRRGSPGRERCSTSALERKIVQKSGSYFSFGDERLGQGRQNATAFLTENPDIVQPILARIQAERRARADRLRAAAADERQAVQRGDAGRRRGGSEVVAGRGDDHRAPRAGAGVAVELDGTRWRTFPSSLSSSRSRGGAELDRHRARALARAASSPWRAVAACARSTRALAGALDGGSTGDGVAARTARGVEMLEEPASWTTRGSPKGGRGSSRNGRGGLLVRDDLERQGSRETARAATAALEPEAERAARIVEARGRAPRRCATSRPAASRRRRSNP